MQRRTFLNHSIKATVGFGAGLTLLANSSLAFQSKANERINLGFIGCGGRGRQLLDGFLTRSDINVLHCCDPQKSQADKAAQKVRDSKRGGDPRLSNDLRTVLDDQHVDAVVCATPDHWHAAACIRACQAGKDVLIEKPASHSAWEGRKMVEAARKYNRIVQHGTQSRSAAYVFDAKKYIEDGKLGKIHFCRVHNMKEWKNFDLLPESPVPDTIDWNLWTGPAPLRPFSPTYLKRWHFFWDYSSGDMIVDGIHQIDLARYLLGKKLPKTVYCTGGRYDSGGAAETPDTQTAVYEFDDLLMNFEMTLNTPYMIKSDSVLRDSDMFPYWMQNTERIELYGSLGLMILGRQGGGWEVYIRPKDRKPVVRDFRYGRFPDLEHQDNFLHCMRTRRRPNADIEEGHLSTLYAHYATISYRLGGEKLVIDGDKETVRDNAKAESYFRRDGRKPFDVPDQI